MVENEKTKKQTPAALWIGVGLASGVALYHVINKMASENARGQTALPVGGRYDRFAEEFGELDY
tara:strand:- start:718 stop:909 length:192 start_codon:yes stop_codon:yes gene_type:complete